MFIFFYSSIIEYIIKEFPLIKVIILASSDIIKLFVLFGYLIFIIKLSLYLIILNFASLSILYILIFASFIKIKKLFEFYKKVKE